MTVEFRDYYQTLGVPRTATPAEIKKAYRKLARQHHPDVKPGDAAAEARFKGINEAHEVLSDPEKRKLYDQLGADWDRYGRAGGGPGSGAGRAGGAADPFGPGGPFAGYARPGRGAGRGGGRGEPRTADAGGFSDFFRTFFTGGMASDGDPAAGGSGPSAGGRGGRERASTGSIEDILAGMGYPAGQAGYPAGSSGPDGLDTPRGDARRVGARGGSRSVEAPVEVTLEEARALAYAPVTDAGDGVVFAGHGAGRAQSTSETARRSTFEGMADFFRRVGIVANVAPGVLGDNPEMAYKKSAEILRHLPLNLARTQTMLRTLVSHKEGLSFNKAQVAACAKHICDTYTLDPLAPLWCDFNLVRGHIPEEVYADGCRRRDEVFAALEAKFSLSR